MSITEAFSRTFAKHQDGTWRISRGKLEAQRGLDGDIVDWIGVSVIDADYVPTDGWVEWNGSGCLQLPAR